MDSIKSTSGAARAASNRRELNRLVCLVACCLSFLTPPLDAQVMGEEAEMARLRAKAEDAIANDDPDGAAMNMGRAALMAAQLAKKQAGFSAQVYQGSEALFRSQEQTYRAIALFRRAGNQLPASSGVCGSLALAQGSLRHAIDHVAGLSAQAPPPRVLEDVAQLTASADNWQTVIESMTAEYQCR